MSDGSNCIFLKLGVRQHLYGRQAKIIIQAPSSAKARQRVMAMLQ